MNKLLMAGLLALSSVCQADCETHFKPGYFFCRSSDGVYSPAYQQPDIRQIISRKPQCCEWQRDNYGCFHRAKYHYSLHNNEGLAVEHYFQ